MVSFLSVPTWDPIGNSQLDLVEFFAGRARVSRLAAWVGYKVRAYDIDFQTCNRPGEFKRGRLRRSAMDLNGAAGFAFLR